jgi:hypothetical protein
MLTLALVLTLSSTLSYAETPPDCGALTRVLTQAVSDLECRAMGAQFGWGYSLRMTTAAGGEFVVTTQDENLTAIRYRATPQSGVHVNGHALRAFSLIDEAGASLGALRILDNGEAYLSLPSSALP